MPIYYLNNDERLGGCHVFTMSEMVDHYRANGWDVRVDDSWCEEKMEYVMTRRVMTCKEITEEILGYNVVCLGRQRDRKSAERMACVGGPHKIATIEILDGTPEHGQTPPNSRREWITVDDGRLYCDGNDITPMPERYWSLSDACADVQAMYGAAVWGLRWRMPQYRPE